MKPTNLGTRITTLLLALLLGLLNSTADRISAEPESQDRLQPYAVVGTAGETGLYQTLANPDPGGQSQAGRSIAMGDVNYDGKDDVAVGAGWEAVGSDLYQGRAYVFSGSDSSLLYTLDIPDPNLSHPNFGEKIAVGDLTGDGKADIVVAAPSWDDNYYLDQGKVYVFSGADGSYLRSIMPPSWNTWEGTYFGFGLAVGDTSGGGMPEIVVGAPWTHVGAQNYRGRVYVFSSGGSLLRTLNTPQPVSHSHFGDSVAVGDVNGDGKADIAVTASGEGRVHVFSGGGSLMFTVSVSGPRSVAIGDVNADGKGDIAVETASSTLVFSGAGGSLLYTLGAGATCSTYAYCGGVAVHDVDGDGRGDIIVGAPGDEQAYVFSGADGSLLFTLAAGGTEFGTAVAAGDVNGDAKADVAVGAYGEAAGYVFSGTAAGHIVRAPCCSLPVRLTADNVLLSSDLGAGPALSVAAAQLHDRWSWRYYDPNGDPWADEDGCFVEVRGPGEEGNDSPYEALVTNCPSYPGDQWEVLESFPDGCPCTFEHVWTLGMPIAGHWSASQTGTWAAYIDYTDPEGTTTPGVVQQEMEIAGVPAVMLVHGWEADCDGISVLRQNLENELGVPPERLDCYEYDSRKGIEDPAKGLGDRILQFRESLDLGSDEEVDLVGHSQGGLVARYYYQFARLPEDGPIGSISMIGTPNDGVKIAKLKDWLCSSANVLMNTIACPIARWLVLETGDKDFASQAVTDMTPGSEILLDMNTGFTLPEPPNLPLYKAYAGTRSTPAGEFISGDEVNDCAIGRQSVGGPDNIFSPATGTLEEYPLTHAVVSFLAGCEEPTLNASPEIARDVAATIKIAPPEAGLASAGGNIATQTEAEELAGAEPIISSVSDYVTPSASKNHTISVPSGLGDTMFVVYWLDSNELDPSLGVTLRRPNDEVVNPSDPDVIQQGEVTGDGMFYVLFRGFVMSAPQAGDWQITVDGLSTPAEGQGYLVALIPMGSQVALGAGTADPSLPEGQPELITAAMFDNAAPIAVTTIAAKVATPAGTEEAVVLSDDGTGGDEVAGDHVYSGTFASTTECGLYGVTVSATGDSSEGTVTRQQFVPFHAQVPGDAIRDPCNPDEDEDGLTDYDELNVVGTDPLDEDTDDDAFRDGVEVYLGTDPTDACPDVVGADDAWPLDVNVDGRVTVVGDVLAYSGRIGATGGPPPSANWRQRLDLNADNSLSVVGDVLKFSGKIGQSCT